MRAAASRCTASALTTSPPHSHALALSSLPTALAKLAGSRVTPIDGGCVTAARGEFAFSRDPLTRQVMLEEDASAAEDELGSYLAFPRAPVHTGSWVERFFFVFSRAVCMRFGRIIVVSPMFNRSKGLLSETDPMINFMDGS